MDTSQLYPDVHKIPLDVLFQRFHTNQHTGLSTEFVLKAKTRYGSNVIRPPKAPGHFRLLLKQLTTSFNLVLWLAGILAIIAYKPLGAATPSITNLGLGVVIFLVIICNGILNVYQKMKSIKIVASFSKLLPRICTVRRDGIEQQIAVDHIVPGDIILVQMGDRLPADCRFLICDGLKINTSEMTGESKPITPTVECSTQTLMESTNIGFHSSFVEQGTGEAMVIATGENTVLGKMSRITQNGSGNEITGLDREINRFVLFIVLAAIISIVILWITWAAWLQYAHPTFITLTGNVLNSVGIIVSFLPFNLASAITIALTIVAKQLHQQHILAKSLQTIEKFNSVTVIATDKTGTLTENNVVVTNILWDIDGEYKIIEEKPLTQVTIPRRIHRAAIRIVPAVEKSLSNSSNEQNSNSNIQIFNDLLLGAALCNDAEKHLAQDTTLDQDVSKISPELRLVGNPVDVALYNLCVYQCHMDINEVRCLNRRLKILPFNSTNKLMISANQLEPCNQLSSAHENTILITLKGAPENVIQRCSSYKNNSNQILPLTIQIKEKLFQRHEISSKHGYRVIGMCQQNFTKIQYDQMLQQYEARQRLRTANDEDFNGFPTNNYCFIGFFSLLDPPRIDVSDSILKIRRAHIRIAMITGDHPTTAKAIGKQVNILSTDISEKNGIDTFKIERKDRNHTVFHLYRDETFVQHHTINTTTPITSESRATRVMMKHIELNIDKDDPVSEPPWYKRWYLSCKNQISESKLSFKHDEEKTIPYAIVVTGFQVDSMDDFMWSWVLSHEELIFARTSPEQKLRIIMEFQRRGETVAVIGDGTNDAPSLKCADLGIAMQSGANVSKEASDMILLDNRFSSIISAIETGRLLSDNLKKVVIYLLPAGTWSELWPVIFNIWFGIPLPLSAFLAIVFCMLNDLTISLALVTEKAETDIMSRPPSNRKKDHLVNMNLLIHAYLLVGNMECFTAFFCYCYYWIDNGVPFYSFMFTYDDFGVKPFIAFSSDQLNTMIITSQSIYYSSLCIFQIFNFFATRTRHSSILQHNPMWGKGKNLYGLGVIIISTGIQLILTQASWFNQIFDTAPVPVKYVLPTFGFGILWLLIDELRKLCIRKFPHGIAAKTAW